MPTRTTARRTVTILATASSLAVLGFGTAPAGAVNADHGSKVVSANPDNATPHVMDGSVDAITQIGNRIIAAGTFTKVSPSGTYSTTSDDVVRNRIFAFDATTGALLETCFRQVEYAGVLAGADNPEGARALVDFLVGRSFQTALPDSMYVYPVDDQAALPPLWERWAEPSPDPVEVDPAQIDDSRDEWIRTWSDVTAG